MPTVKVIYFDLGRVLVDFDWSRAVREMARCATADPESIYACVTASPPALEYELGKIDSDTFFDFLKRKILFQESVEHLRRLWNDIFTPLDDTLRIADALRRDYPLGLISNTNESHVAHIRSQFQFLSYFTPCVFSYETGFLKPAREIYQKAESLCQAAASEILFIDDREENVRGAHALGWKVIHFKTGTNLMFELESVLGRKII